MATTYRCLGWDDPEFSAREFAGLSLENDSGFRREYWQDMAERFERKI